MVNKMKLHDHDHECRYCQLERHEPLIMSSKAGYVVPSIGAMVEGWVLVFPERHVLALSDLTGLEWSEFEVLIRRTRATVEAEFGETVLFEHGSAGIGRTAACGVDHAHMHVVPLAIDLRKAVAACSDDVGSFDWSRVVGRPDVIAGNDYLYISDRTGKWVARSPWLPGQVIRRAIANHLGSPVWDWKADSHLDLVESTRRKLAAA
jgi:ATP adenylyltransferase